MLPELLEDGLVPELEELELLELELLELLLELELEQRQSIFGVTL